MDTDTLDALLMDHALGQTRGDLATLIDAYVEKDPEARQSLDRWQHVSHTAREALRTADASLLLPPFPRKALQRSDRRAHWISTLAPVSAMAACLCLGFFLGTRSTPPAPVAPAPGVRALSPPLSTPTNVAAVPDFWSVARFRAHTFSKASENPLVSLWTAHSRDQLFGPENH